MYFLVNASRPYRLIQASPWSAVGQQRSEGAAAVPGGRDRPVQRSGNWPGPLGIDQPTAGHSAPTRLYGKEAGCKVKTSNRGGNEVGRGKVVGEV